MEWLAESNHLVHRGEITHRYPYDWRAKKPVIFRVTPQWFIRTKHLVQNQPILDSLKVVA